MSTQVQQTLPSSIPTRHGDSTLRQATMGLCSNCNQQENCCICAESDAPVWECELYECSTCKETETSPITTAENNTQKQDVHVLGLCLNCEMRSQCALPKPPAGVWYCEEYC